MYLKIWGEAMAKIWGGCPIAPLVVMIQPLDLNAPSPVGCTQGRIKGGNGGNCPGPPVVRGLL